MKAATKVVRPKVIVVMPAYNAAKTLHMTYTELPHDLALVSRLLMLSSAALPARA